MIIERLLDTALFAALGRRLEKQRARAPEHGLISITLDLGPCGEDWLTSDIARADVFYWAQPSSVERSDDKHSEKKSGDYRLALGRAMVFATQGAARFSALQAAFSGLQPVWRDDDSQQTGVAAAAHIGFAFEDEGQADLPNAQLCVPAILLQNRAGRGTATFSCAVRDADNALARWRAELQNSLPASHAAKRTSRRLLKPNAPIRTLSPLNDRAFLARAHAALHDIAAGKIEKVVLTRRVHFEAAQAIAVTPLLAALVRRHPECTIYGVGQPGGAFVGATPEHLVSLHKGFVRADALAGTAWLSATSDSANTGSLTLQGNKNSYEQQLVVDAVRAALATLCVALDPPQTPEIMQLRALQHLRTRIGGRLRDGIDLFDLLAHLHPTPAVGGTPTLAARQWLHAHGEQRSAWYTGGIGWIDRHGNGEIAVPLRCASIKGTQADLFAGAGIVAGSDPVQELAETEVKLSAIVDALQHAVHLDECTDADSDRTGTQ